MRVRQAERDAHGGSDSGAGHLRLAVRGSPHRSQRREYSMVSGVTPSGAQRIDRVAPCATTYRLRTVSSPRAPPPALRRRRDPRSASTTANGWSRSTIQTLTVLRRHRRGYRADRSFRSSARRATASAMLTSPPTRTACTIPASRSSTRDASSTRPRSPSGSIGSSTAIAAAGLGPSSPPDSFGLDPILRVHTARVPRLPRARARALARGDGRRRAIGGRWRTPRRYAASPTSSRRHVIAQLGWYSHDTDPILAGTWTPRPARST